MISGAKPSSSPTCSTAPHERSGGLSSPPCIVSQYRCNRTRRKALAELDTWISRARSSLVAAFANGVSKDKAAAFIDCVRAYFFCVALSAAVLVGDEADHVFLI